MSKTALTASTALCVPQLSRCERAAHERCAQHILTQRLSAESAEPGAGSAANSAAPCGLGQEEQGFADVPAVAAFSGILRSLCALWLEHGPPLLSLP